MLFFVCSGCGFFLGVFVGLCFCDVLCFLFVLETTLRGPVRWRGLSRNFDTRDCSVKFGAPFCGRSLPHIVILDFELVVSPACERNGGGFCQEIVVRIVFNVARLCFELGL